MPYKISKVKKGYKVYNPRSKKVRGIYKTREKAYRRLHYLYSLHDF